jgi:hypothetical protein
MVCTFASVKKGEIEMILGDMSFEREHQQLLDKTCADILISNENRSSMAEALETTVAASTMASPKKTVSSAAQPGKGDAIGALLNAIFGKDVPELGEIRVHFPDDLTGQEFDELLRQATAGLDFTTDPSFQHVKMVLRNLQDSGGGGGGRDAKEYSKTINIRICLWMATMTILMQIAVVRKSGDRFERY